MNEKEKPSETPQEEIPVIPDTPVPAEETPDTGTEAPTAQEEVPAPEVITPEYVKSLEDQVAKFEQANGKLYDLIEATPELLEVVRQMLGGKKFRSAILSVISTDDLSPKEGDGDYPDAMAALTDRQNFLKGKKEKEDQVMKNIEASAHAIEEFKQTNQLNDQEIKSFLESIDTDVSDMLDGKMTVKMLTHLWKASRYDSDVEMTAEQAKIAGRNEQIEVMKQTKKDDGLPALTHSSDLPPKVTRPRTKADIWAEEEKKRKII
jgi:hypothetical protein